MRIRRKHKIHPRRHGHPSGSARVAAIVQTKIASPRSAKNIGSRNDPSTFPSFTQTEYFYRLLRKHVQPESRRMTNE